jgi:antitoxin (DNA-binding transcriptional repressor) of toxin-antitoxin stability system
MTQIDVQQMEANPGVYLAQVANGETIVICRDQQPIAEMRPVEQQSKMPRPLGLGIGTGFIHPSFHEPLPDEVIESFYNSDLGIDFGDLEKNE